ncbi:cache domain-containing sensor histidine kinase [Cohnella mopanensis]|uniref:cache domain-containing sensor histidine kinase n=1 Tax=Cohnella mopanensis TaxID=2911966 RepID=UPI001EF850A8
MWLRQIIKFNTLRNQMLFGFLLVMIIILAVVGIVTFDSVSTLLKNKAEVHIQQTAVQANGRLEGILEQIDSLTTLVSTNSYVQSLLLKELNGQPATFTERQALPPIVNVIQIYSDGVKSVELYNYDRKRIFPLDEAQLEDKISEERIAQTTAEKGGIIWFGIDPADKDSVLAIRRISLIDNNFSSGGYLLVRIKPDVFTFQEPLSGEGERETMLLLGNDGQIIASNDPSISKADAAAWVGSESQTVNIGKQSYILVSQKSDVTGWTLFILTPISAITKGITVLRTAIFVSAGIGTLLFILLSLLLSTIITRPVFKLIKTMRGTRLGVLKPTDIVTSTIEINELNHTYNQMVNNINELIRLVYEKELLQSRTELKALQAQINPHFLFNTLEALYWSLQEKAEDELAEFVVAMSDLFRYTIVGPNKDEWVSLGDELEHIERYLLIMKMRFGERLTWDIVTLPEFDSVRLPKLLIQPFVENAILHGVENNIGRGTVIVSVSRTENEDELAITVEDNGAGMDEATLRSVTESLEYGQVPSTKKSGMGIGNVYRRIKLYYADDARTPGRIAIHSRSGEGTRVILTIPRGAEGSYENANDYDR